MFSFFSNKLTAASNHYVDWSRVGELIYSGKHRYSLEEMAVRGAIILTTAASAFIGYNHNDEETTGCSSTTLAIAAGIIGFTVSHSVLAVAPLMYKRYKMSAECKQLVNEIIIQTRDLPDTSLVSLHQVIEQIFKLTLANEKHSNASLTWGKRRTLLKNLHMHLENEDEDLLTLLEADEVNTIVDKLEKATASLRPNINRLR